MSRGLEKFNFKKGLALSQHKQDELAHILQVSVSYLEHSIATKISKELQKKIITYLIDSGIYDGEVFYIKGFEDVREVFTKARKAMSMTQQEAADSLDMTLYRYRSIELDGDPRFSEYKKFKEVCRAHNIIIEKEICF